MEEIRARAEKHVEVEEDQAECLEAELTGRTMGIDPGLRMRKLETTGQPPGVSREGANAHQDSQ
ncbi:hypothetical protein CR513_61523, partial [Mucuna pruriens]